LKEKVKYITIFQFRGVH